MARYGYISWHEADRRWTADVGHQGADNLATSEEEAEGGIEDLAAVLEIDPTHVRVVEFVEVQNSREKNLWHPVRTQFPAPASRSGTPWTEDQRAARGRGRMTLRMSSEAHEMLAELADDAGCSASERVEELVREAHGAMGSQDYGFGEAVARAGARKR